MKRGQKQNYLIVKGPSYAPKLFQRFLLTILEIFLSNFERFPKNALILSIFELEKCSFFPNRTEFDWYYYQGPSPAPFGVLLYQPFLAI